MSVLQELLLRLSQHTRVVLCLDDLQWGDVDSARFLAELLSPPGAPPLLLITSYRASEARSSAFLVEFEQLLAGSTRQMARSELRLEPLPPEISAQLAMRRLGTSSLQARTWAEHIARESRGNPLFIEELARAPSTEVARERGPPGPSRSGTSSGGASTACPKRPAICWSCSRSPGGPPARTYLSRRWGVRARPCPLSSCCGPTTCCVSTWVGTPAWKSPTIGFERTWWGSWVPRS
ncbi:hypothetical protein ACN28S_63925 [Cystobacter fuscus]